MLSIILIILLLIIYIVCTKVNDNFVGNRILVRKCFTPKMDIKNRNIFLELINVVNNILVKYNIDWIPIGGNLISIYRYKTLILPWDDDFDFVVEKKKNIYALEVLKTELPNYGCKIVFIKKWLSNNSLLYKIFFKSKKKYSNKNHNFNWPFIDFFVNNNYKSTKSFKNPINFRNSNMPNDLTIDEYPLIKLKCDGITIKVPSKGFRSYDEMKKSNIIDLCYDDSLNHYNIRHVPCLGTNIIKCKTLPFKMSAKNIFEK